MPSNENIKMLRYSTFYSLLALSAYFVFIADTLFCFGLFILLTQRRAMNFVARTHVHFLRKAKEMKWEGNKSHSETV